MFTLATEAELISTFRPKDRRGLEVAPELQFPLKVDGCVSWIHPAGGKAFMVFAVPGGAPTGLAFDTNEGSGVVQMCDWCHCSSGGGDVALLVATLSGKKRVGVYLCRDLSCARKLEEQSNLSGARFGRALEKLVTRIGKFANEGLGIDLMGANR